MLTFQLAGANIVLPDLELIPAGRVRDNVCFALVVRDERSKAMLELATADDDLRRIRESEVLREAAILSTDPSRVIEDSTDAVEAAEKRVRKARARVQALDVVAGQAVAAIRDAVADTGDKWAKKAVASTSKALGDLVAAIDLAERAREKLYASVGVLGMLRDSVASPTGTRLAIEHKPGGYTFSIDGGMSALREALASARDELAEHTAALSIGKSKPARTAAPAAPDADTEPTAPAVSPFEITRETSDEITFEIGADDDDL